MVKKPKMVLFDYGQTLINELYYDGAKGYDAMLEYAVSNPHGVTGEQINIEVEKFNGEVGRFSPTTRHREFPEITERSISQYIFALHGVEFDRDLSDFETLFWDAAAPGEPCRGIVEFLRFLDDEGIRTGVVSNISYCEKSLRRRLERCLPESNFELVIASSEYVFRKPSRHIFEIALLKAGLDAEDVWFCGDQFRCDIEGALAVGMTPVWYKEYIRYDQDCEMKSGFEINSWDELREIMCFNN